MPARWLLVLFLLALASRAGWGTFRELRADVRPVLEFPDERQYWSMAKSFRAGEGLRDELGFLATRMPLFPAYLSLFASADTGVLLARISMWIMGAVGACLAACTAATLFDRRVGCVAGAMVAVDPFFVFFSSLLLTETIYISAVLGLWWSLSLEADSTRQGGLTWVVLGGLSSVCVYLRESSLGLIVLALAWAALRQGVSRRSAIRFAISMGVVAASLAPWALRNRMTIGEWCWLTTRGGISLYDGVRPGATGASDLGDIKQTPAVVGLNESQWNRYFIRASIRAIQDDPWRVLKLAGVKIVRLWSPLPHADHYQSDRFRWISAGWVIPLYLLAAVGAALLPLSQGRRGWYKLGLLVLPIGYFTMVHAVFVGSVRYRLGAMPMVVMLAAFVWVTLVDRLRVGATIPEVPSDVD